MLVNCHGPIHDSQALLNASEFLRCKLKPGMGRALLDKVRLECQPGPHQRSTAPAVKAQLPNA